MGTNTRSFMPNKVRTAMPIGIARTAQRTKMKMHDSGWVIGLPPQTDSWLPCAEGTGQRFRRGQQRVNSVLILGRTPEEVCFEVHFAAQQGDVTDWLTFRLPRLTPHKQLVSPLLQLCIRARTPYTDRVVQRTLTEKNPFLI